MDDRRQKTDNTQLREADAAKYLDMSVAYLRSSRLQEARSVGPRFIRIGRSIRYRREDLDRFLEEHTVTPGSRA